MTHPLEIRPAQPHDSALLLEFIKALAEYEKLAHEVTATEQLVRETLFGPRPYAEALLAFWSGRPAGVAIYFFAYSTFRAQPVLYLEDLFVKPALRGQGVGKALFHELLRVAAARNCGRFEWSVLDWNKTAIDFYESLGAKPQREWIKYRLEQDQIRTLAASPGALKKSQKPS